MRLTKKEEEKFRWRLSQLDREEVLVLYSMLAMIDGDFDLSDLNGLPALTDTLLDD